MAKRKSKMFRTRTVLAKKKYSKKSGSLKLNPFKPIHIGYGFLREKVAKMIEPVSSKIPLLDYADEVTIGALAFLGGKQFPKMKKVAQAILDIENYRVGELLSRQSRMVVSNGASSLLYN